VVVVFLPILSYLIMVTNLPILDEKAFKQKFGSFCSGYATHNEAKRNNCKFLMSWFLVRRLLTAVNLVSMRNQTVYVQIAINIQLCLIDVIIKLYLKPYENSDYYVQTMNDVIVLLLSEFIFLFTDVTNSI
jgi:hypothetical protein